MVLLLRRPFACWSCRASPSAWPIFFASNQRTNTQQHNDKTTTHKSSQTPHFKKTTTTHTHTQTQTQSKQNSNNQQQSATSTRTCSCLCLEGVRLFVFCFWFCFCFCSFDGRGKEMKGVCVLRPLLLFSVSPKKESEHWRAQTSKS